MSQRKINGRPAIILLAEDDPADQELVKRALEEGKIRNELHIVQDGEEALDYLYQRGRYSDPQSCPRPDLFLLDLNMPKIGGRQLLEQIQDDTALKKINTVILTTSKHEDDIAHCYDLGIKSYINKPVEYDQFMETILALSEYWFQIVVLPPQD